MALQSRGSDKDKLTLQQAKILVECYTPERYARELPDKLIKALAKAPIVDERLLDAEPEKLQKVLKEYGYPIAATS